MTQTYDAIVIGAGVMGASIAFHLAERGLKVAILERKVTAQVQQVTRADSSVCIMTSLLNPS